MRRILKLKLHQAVSLIISLAMLDIQITRFSVIPACPESLARTKRIPDTLE